MQLWRQAGRWVRVTPWLGNASQCHGAVMTVCDAGGGELREVRSQLSVMIAESGFEIMGAAMPPPLTDTKPERCLRKIPRQ